MGFERQIASAKRQLEAKGQACLWRKPAGLDGSADAWRDLRTGNATDYSVFIAWFSPRDVQRGREEFMQQLAGQMIDVPQGHQIGLMGAFDFAPLASDTIVKGTDASGPETSIVSVDLIAPNGVPIMYYVKVKL